MIHQDGGSLLYNRIVLGTAGLGGVWRKVNQEASVRAILYAFEHGILTVDTAPAYGDAESFIGQALKRWEGPAPVISTKVGRLKSFAINDGCYDYSDQVMQQSVEDSLRTMNIPVIDILFLHEPAVVPQQDVQRVIGQMQSFKEKGYAKQIGLGGNFPDYYNSFIESGVFDVVMEFNRMNACCIDALLTTMPLCKSSNTAYFAASPLNMGLLGCQFEDFTKTPPDWLDNKFVVQAKKIASIARKYNIGLAELSHRFLFSFPEPFKIVLGAADRMQLEDSLQGIGSGVLPELVFNEIIHSFNKYEHGSD